MSFVQSVSPVAQNNFSVGPLPLTGPEKVALRRLDETNARLAVDTAARSAFVVRQVGGIVRVTQVLDLRSAANLLAHGAIVRTGQIDTRAFFGLTEKGGEMLRGMLQTRIRERRAAHG